MAIGGGYDAPLLIVIAALVVLGMGALVIGRAFGAASPRLMRIINVADALFVGVLVIFGLRRLFYGSFSDVQTELVTIVVAIALLLGRYIIDDAREPRMIGTLLVVPFAYTIVSNLVSSIVNGYPDTRLVNGAPDGKRIARRLAAVRVGGGLSWRMRSDEMRALVRRLLR